MWTLGAGLDKVSAVNSPDDDYTTYIRGYTNRQEQYTLDPTSIPPGSTINSVSVISRVECPNGETATAYLYLGANQSNGTPRSPLLWQSYTEAIARPGGGSWDQTDLSTLEVGIIATNSPYTACACTTLEVVVDYTPAAPGATGDMLLVF